MRSFALTSAALAALWITPASADIVITDDSGGSISQYTQRYAMARDSGERVVIDGLCFSACTMAIGMLSRGQVCVTKNALLGFHAAWRPNGLGGRVTSVSHTERLMGTYPQGVRSWIARRGGLSSEMKFLFGRELRGLIPLCKSSPARSAAARSFAPATASAPFAAAHIEPVAQRGSKRRSGTTAVEQEISLIAARLGL